MLIDSIIIKVLILKLEQFPKTNLESQSAQLSYINYCIICCTFLNDMYICFI